mgnify:CR=1 FL=1
MNSNFIYEIDWKDFHLKLMGESGQREKNEKYIIDNNILYRPHEEMGEFGAIWPFTIAQTARIDITSPVHISAYFMMNDNAVILRHEHPTYRIIPLIMQALTKTITKEDLIIESDVWLQRNVVVMPKVTRIHKGSIILVGSILTKNTDRENGIWGGNPARFIRLRGEVEPYDTDYIDKSINYADEEINLGNSKIDDIEIKE